MRWYSEETIGHDPAPLATDWWDQFLADFYTFEPGPDPPDTS